MPDANVALIAFLVFVIVVVLIFRGPLSEQFNRLVSAKAEGAGAKVGLDFAPPSPQPELPKAGGVEDQEDEEDEEEPGQQIAGQTSDEEHETFYALWGAGVSRDEERFEQLAEQLKAEAEDEKERRRARVQILAVRYITGFDPSAVEQLKEIAAGEPESRVLALHFLALAHRAANDLRAAEQAHREALRQDLEPDQRSELSRELSETLIQAGRPDEAIGILRKELGRGDVSSAETFQLWQLLSEAADQADRKPLALMAKERASRLRANDAEVQFRTAYLYGEQGTKFYSPAAIHHYLTSLRFNHDQAFARNNMAIRYKQLELPISAVSRFREEADRGETLAMANLAREYLTAGFKDEAEKLLAEAEKSNDPDPGVARIRAELIDDEAREDQRRAEITDDGRQQAELLSDMADAVLRGPSPILAGTWIDGGGAPVEVSVESDGSVRIEWKMLSRGQRFDLQQDGDALTGERRRESLYSSYFERVSEALGCRQPDGALRLVHEENGRLHFETYRRADATNA